MIHSKNTELNNKPHPNEHSKVDHKLCLMKQPPNPPIHDPSSSLFSYILTDGTHMIPGNQLQVQQG